jgi:hypothetical protein
MGVKVTIEWNGLSTVIGNLDAIAAKAPSKLEEQVGELAKDTLSFWREVTPKRTGRLAGGESAPASGLQFTLNDGVKYYPFVDEGHMTPRGWHTRHGYRPAKRRSHVAGKFMTQKAVDFIEGNITNYLSKFLD